MVGNQRQERPSRFPPRQLRLVFRKSRHLRARKAFRKTPTRLFRKAALLYVVKGMKMKTTAKFRALRRLRCTDTKRIISPEMGPKSFGTFEKQAPEESYCGTFRPLFSLVPTNCGFCCYEDKANCVCCIIVCLALQSQTVSGKVQGLCDNTKTSLMRSNSV